MKLYLPLTKNQLKPYEQYFPFEAEISCVEDLKYITQYDHLTVKMNDGRRLKDRFKETDVFYADIDNTGSEKCSLEQFNTTFGKYEYYTATSKSHQKIKVSNDGIEHEEADRFHIYFPIKKIDSLKIYEDLIKSAHEKYKFFDKAAKDVSRILFSSPNSIIEYHKGESIYSHFQDLSWSKTIIKYDEPIVNKITEKSMMKVLEFASSEGEFEDYEDWLKLGISLKAGGFTHKDWLKLSNNKVSESFIYSKWKSITLRQNGITERHIYNIKEKYWSELVQKKLMKE